MIDLVYKTLSTIINKENNGYISPTEFNLLANKVQGEIFREYFENENRDKVKENKGLTNKGYGNLDFNQRQMLSPFFEKKLLIPDAGDEKLYLPEDLYLIEDDGIVAYFPNNEEDEGRPSDEGREGAVIEEIERGVINYMMRSTAKPTTTYPVYERYSKHIDIYPRTIKQCIIRYIRNPKMPVWTYEVINNKEMFNPSKSSYQDFELHSSEFNNIVTRMLSAFSINLRELEITKIAEQIKNEITIKDNE